MQIYTYVELFKLIFTEQMVELSENVNSILQDKGMDSYRFTVENGESWSTGRSLRLQSAQ
jgi:hypothetical protein